MSDPRFTILLPIVRPPDLLRLAVASVLAQRQRDFELLIVCDGAPPETVAAAEAFGRQDRRIQTLAFPKGARNGEAHRHTALQQARGTFVCQIADDDLWFPDHLDEIAKLLAEHEFGNLLQTRLGIDGEPEVIMADLADPAVHTRMLAQRYNVFGPTAAGYRLDAYRRLAEGWTPAPPEIWSDLFMWRKFLAHPGLTFGTRFAITSLKFTNKTRRDWSMAHRLAEMAEHAAIIATEDGCERLRQRALRQHARRSAYRERALARLGLPLDGAGPSRS